MASMWRRAMLYLGLGPDEEYEDYDLDDQRVPARAEPVAAAARPASAPRVPTREPAESSSVRPLAASGASEPAKPRPAVVRPVPAAANAKPYVVAPTSFNHAQEVADKFKASQPVIVNLQGADRDLSRRLIDFASGVCYGLGGHMERVASQVYLLTPSNVEVSAEERRRLQERGFDA
jgi:cell division inhibitor SepF